MLKNTYLGLFVTFVLVSSVYVLPPGMPQPPDFIAAMLVAFLFTTFVIPVPVNNDLFLVGGLLLADTMIVNLYWYGQLQETGFLRHAIYYVFNFGAFLVTVSLARTLGDRFITAFRIAIAIAIFLEIVALFVLSPSAFRSAGTFNSPNQLGYWALLLSCCLLVLKRDQKLNLLDFAVLCGAGYLTMASLSKAAMLAFVLLLVTAIVFQRLTRPIKLLFTALAVIASAVAITDSTQFDKVQSVGVVESVSERLSNIGGQGDDSLGGRGYDRIWRFPEYLILGAGEGAYWRFSAFQINARQTDLEMHSTFGTVLFAYGIVGLTLFLALLALVFWRAPLGHALYSLPIWAYGMTHQGSRDTMLWVFLGLVFGLAHYGRSAHRRVADQPASDDGAVLAGSPNAPLTSFRVRGPQRSREPSRVLHRVFRPMDQPSKVRLTQIDGGSRRR
jgi:O-Antigen ligase